MWLHEKQLLLIGFRIKFENLKLETNVHPYIDNSPMIMKGIHVLSKMGIKAMNRCNFSKEIDLPEYFFWHCHETCTPANGLQWHEM